MAKKNNEEDPEEDKKDQFDDDEDFGLPDLEYEELSDDDDESDSGEVEKPVGEEEFGSDLDTSDVSEETEDWEKELEKELDDELKAEETSDEDNLFYEEESYDEFEDTKSTGEESVFGTEEASGSSTPPPTYIPQYDTGDSNRGKFTRIVVIGTLLFAVIAIVFWLVSDTGSPKPKEPIAEAEPPQEVVPADTTPVVEQPIVEPEPTGSQANKRAPGEITVLEQQTGKSYIVIGSFFDGDLANDYAKKLSADGKSPLIIPPFKNYRFHRVAIAEFESFRDAQASIDTYKQEYGDAVWPLRY